MGNMRSELTAHLIGSVSLAISLGFWILVLRQIWLPSEGVTDLAVLGSLAGSIYAASKGSRWWLIGVLISIFTAVIAIGFARI